MGRKPDLVNRVIDSPDTLWEDYLFELQKEFNDKIKIYKRLKLRI